MLKGIIILIVIIIVSIIFAKSIELFIHILRLWNKINNQ